MNGLSTPVQPAWIDGAIALLQKAATELRAVQSDGAQSDARTNTDIVEAARTGCTNLLIDGRAWVRLDSVNTIPDYIRQLVRDEMGWHAASQNVKRPGK